MARFSDITRIRQPFKTYVPWLFRIHNVYLLTAIILSISLAIVAGRGFLQFEGFVYHAENLEAYNLDQFQDRFYPLWNERTQMFIIHDMPKLYVTMPLIGIAKAINAVTGIDGYKTIQAILLLSPISIAFLSAFKLTHYIASKFSFNSFIQFMSAILAAFIFTINPWFANNPRQYIWRLDYAMLPLFAYLFIRMIHSGDRKYIIFLAVAIAVFAAYRAFLITILMFAIILILDIIISGRERILAKLFSVGILAGLVFLLMAAKLLPSILYSSGVEPAAVTNFNLNMVFRESMLEILTTKTVEPIAGLFELTYNDNFHMFFIPITLFGFLYPFLLYKKYKVSKLHHLLLALPLVLYSAFILLSAEALNLDRLIINESNSFSEEIGRLLRHARWNIMPALVGLGIMIALSSLKIFSTFKRPYIYALLTSFLVVTSSISAWPIFSGDLNGYWRPSPPPKDYMDFNQILQERGDQHHIVWFPQYSGDQRALWSNSQGASDWLPPTGEFPVGSSSLPSYLTSEFYFFDYYNPVQGVRSLNPMPIYNGNLTKAYSPLNIHYIGITHDTAWTNTRQSLGFTNEYLEHTADEFANKSSANTIFKGNYLTGLELKNDAEEFYSARPILVLDRLSTYGELLPFIDKQSGMVIGTSQEAIERGAEVSDDLVLSDSMDLLVLAKNKVVLEPAEFTGYVDPTRIWSTASRPDLPLYNHLFSKKLSWSWPLDYGYGLAYTSAPNAILQLEANIPETADYQIFLRYLENDAGGSFKVNIDEKTGIIDTFREDGSNFKWAYLGSHHFSNGKKEISLENLNGLNLVNVMMIIPSNISNIYDGLETAVDEKDLIYSYQAEHDFNELGKEGEQASTRYSGAGLQFLENTTLGLTLNILKESDYRLTLDGVGNFSFTIIDKNGNIKQTDQLESNTMDYIHSNNPVHLTKGEYRLLISPTRGSYLDQSWFYTGEQPIGRQLNSDPVRGQVISYDKISSTHYEVKVKSDAPFLLAFAEGYDRYWTAKATSANDSRQFNNMPLYGVINGFWVDKTGEFTVVIEYEPQEWFNISVIISAVSFAFVILYLGYRHFKIRKLSENSMVGAVKIRHNKKFKP